MADAGPFSGSTKGAVSEDREAQVRALMQPAALEARLAEARVRRAKALSQRARDTRDTDAESPAPPSDLPPDAVRPLVSDDEPRLAGRSVHKNQHGAKVGDAFPSLPPRSSPCDPTPDATAQVLRLVPAQEARPHPAPALVNESDADAAPSGPVMPARVPGRPLRTPLLALLALVGGVVIGLAGAALVPDLGGWQIVIVRPAAEAVPDATAAGNEEAAAVATEVPPVFGRSVAARGAATLDSSPTPPPPELAATPPEAFVEPGAQPELPHPGEHAGAALSRVDGPGAPPRVKTRIAEANALPDNHAARTPAAIVAPTALEPAWQAPALEVPAVPQTGRALTAIPASPPPPNASEPALSHSARAADIVLHHPASAAEAAAAARSALEVAGVNDVMVRQIALSIRTPNVRYFHGEDRETAAELAELLTAELQGREVAARDFTSYQPAPEPGLIEIWIDGSAPVAARMAAPRADPAGVARARLVRSLEERLRERLR